MSNKNITEKDIPEGTENFEEVKEKIKELGDVNKQLKITAAKTKVLNKRKKELNVFILPCLRKKRLRSVIFQRELSK